MKFIHTSDWHIGRLFQNISLLEDQLHVLEQIKNYAKVHQVDALIIAGDIFDRSVPPADAVEALDHFLDEISSELKLPIIMISGNHDSSKRLGFGASHMRLSGLHILSQLSDVIKPVIIETATGTVHFYGIPYHDPVEVREAFACEVSTYDEAHTFLVDQIKQVRVAGVPSVVISHCFIDGAEESESERPLSIGGADRVSYQPLEDFDYVALGHLHGPQYKGAEHIRYSGSLLKYSFSEYLQNKGVTLVELDENGLVATEHLPLKAQKNLRIIEGLLDDILEQGKDDPDNEDYLFIRLLDKQDILDPLGQLRKVYPNTLQLERTQFILSKGSQLKADVSLKRTEKQVFNDFFKQVIGHDLTEEQSTLLLDIIAEAKGVIEGKE
ncbi:MAG TPA: exonuclease SbcCD subunit D [Methyloprofundus sp.]|uniref:exonuclease SbcCD subunit D n=1 Tax=Methyloprofundus sp. TaxID=2020875 RepID=UPI0017CD5BBD|nr:exonuclease SbcCD subunit D [Methyloprofundus sp.]HIG65042.1 exonuclease SbcCD subunit D [Methyloprofundus sp.]HIL79477.1 exonuclease SbcCD subunit D [Methylococcales bacterium]